MTSSILLLSILAVAMLGVVGLHASAQSNLSFNTVKINVQTSADLQYSFVTSAYNTTGSLVAYSQTNYPATAFELPSGTYLLTVTAYNQPYYSCNVCMAPAGYNSVATAATPGSSGVALPIRYYPSVEYGSVVQAVNGDTSITIKTQNTSMIATSDVTIKVAYANGTVAAGAYVSAFVVGQTYYWWGANSAITMYGQTNSQGVATLVVPQAPVEVSAYLSVPIILPNNETTVQKVVGGQKVNVTVFWEPTEVSLSGSTLIVPPLTSGNITLQYQQQQSFYPLASSGAATTVPGSATSAPGQQGSAASSSKNSGTSSTQSQSGPALSISPFNLSPSGTVSTQTSHTETASSANAAPSQPSITVAAVSGQSLTLIAGVSALVAVAAVASLVLVMSHRRH